MKFEVFSSAETAPDWQSRAIMKALNCNYSHIGVLINDVQIFHSTGEGVNEKHTDTFLVDHVFIERFDITSFVFSQDFAKGWCKGNIGKDYSETQYLGFINKNWRRLSSDGSSEMICSEFGARFIDECTSISIFDHVNCDFVDPVQFMNEMRKIIIGSRWGVK